MIWTRAWQIHDSMNIQNLVQVLTNLSNEARRRNSDIKNHCDVALTDLKQFNHLMAVAELPATIKSHILSPFMISCTVNNARFANLAIPAIHKLITNHSINESDLSQLIKSFLEASHLAMDIQLRILQCLPSLMQSYNDSINGELLLNLLNVCASLTMNNKSTVVINTASATLQQLFNSIYDKIPTDVDPLLVANINQIKLGNDLFSVDNSANEGFLIFQDLCESLERKPTTYYKDLNRIKVLTILEIIESIFLNHVLLFSQHLELNYLTRVKLVPSLLRFLTNSEDFALIVRVMRVLSVLLSTQLLHLVIEGEIVLSTMNHLLIDRFEDNEWEKLLVLEIFKHLFTNFNIVKTIFELYDYDSKKKNVIEELLSILDVYLTHHPLTPTITTQQLTPSAPNGIYISNHSHIKVSMLDLLDKSDPVSVVPTYSISLIFQILVLLTEGIANFVTDLSFRNEDLESKVELMNNFIVFIYPNLLKLFQYYLHCIMDNDHFHTLTREFQRLIHTTGLLGLTDLRDDLLNELSRVIIHTDSSKFTSRHITCLRALINLGTSLGSTLNDSWKIIWITLQWSDYYINGADEFSGNHDKKITQDITTITNSMSKLYDSIKDYPVDIFLHLLTSLIELFNDNITDKDSNLKSPFCSHNKAFFIKKVYEISTLNLDHFVVNSDIYNSLIDFFIELGINSQLNFNFKSYIITMYTDLIKELTHKASKSEVHYNSINLLCLKGLNTLLDRLKKNETLTINNHVQIHLEVLATLNGMFESYDKRLVDEEIWDTIFAMINESFDHNYGEKESLIINSSFNCLKLIMNEFIMFLPLSKFRVLTDTLFNFCIHLNDLNISFSSISYFWLISDSLKKFQDLTNESTGANITEQLNSSNEDIRQFQIYLLLQLIKLSQDERAQVRDGSLQTFFEIIEIHGESFNPTHWSTIYSLIFNEIFLVKDLGPEFKETVRLKLDGMISIYKKFTPSDDEIWGKLVKFNKELIGLQRIEINIIVLTKFHDLLNLNVSISVLNMFYDFWRSIPIDYEFSDVDTYLEQLNCLAVLFPLIHEKFLMQTQITIAMVSEILNIFTKVLRYPIIVYKLDDETPTTLQKNIMINIELLIDKHPPCDEINSLILKELGNLSVYQFKIREKIESKLMNSNLKLKYKLPTFISISNIAMALIKVAYGKISDINSIINDGTLVKLQKCMLEIVENKAVNWVEASEFLLILIETFFNSDSNDQETWKLITYCVEVDFLAQNQQQEDINIQHYFKLINLISPHLTNEDTINQLIKNIYNNSYLYKFNEIDYELFNDDLEITINNFVSYNFHDVFGTTKQVEFYQLNKMKLICLEQLIKYSIEGSPGDGKFSHQSFKYFLVRLIFSLRRVIEESKLVNKLPMNSILTQEITLLLNGLLTYINNNYDALTYGLLRLVTRLLSELKVEHLRDITQEILAKLVLVLN